MLAELKSFPEFKGTALFCNILRIDTVVGILELSERM